MSGRWYGVTSRGVGEEVSQRKVRTFIRFYSEQDGQSVEGSEQKSDTI